MSRESSLAKNTFILSLGQILPKAAWIITLPIITDMLSHGDYYTYEIIGNLVSLFLPVATLQMQSAAFRFLIDCREDEERRNEVVSNVVFFVIISSVLSLTVLFFCLPHIDVAIRLVVCLYFLTDILMLTLVQIVRGLAQPLLYTICTSVQPLVNMVLVILLVKVYEFGLMGALISLTASTTVALIMVIVKGGIIPMLKLSKFNRGQLKALIQYSWPMVPNSLSLWVLNFSDRLVLKKMINEDVAGIYSAAYKIPQIFALANSAFTMAWQENASESVKQEDASEYYGKMFSSMLRILAGIMALLIAATPILFMILIKGNNEEAYPQLPLLLMAMFFTSLSSFFGGIYVAKMKTKSVGITTIVAAVINLAIDLILVDKIGMYAASVSTLVAYIFIVVYRMINVQTFQKIKYDLKQFICYVVFLSIMAVLLYINTLPTIVLNLAIGIAFAGFVNWELIKKLFNKYIKRGAK